MRLFYFNAAQNFGDELSPIIMEKMLGRPIQTIALDELRVYRRFERLLFGLGSIFHFVQNGDVIWGSGVNDIYKNPNNLKNISIRAVRGPLTKKYIEENYNIQCPNVFGDPALLLPELFPFYKHNPKRKVGILPHLQDADYLEKYSRSAKKYNRPWTEILEFILSCELIISSSLHGIIVAEAFGVPARWLRNEKMPSSKTESTFKYNDYYLSTHRSINDWVETVEEGLIAGGKEPIPSSFDTKKLKESFPYDLFKPYRECSSTIFRSLDTFNRLINKEISKSIRKMRN